MTDLCTDQELIAKLFQLGMSLPGHSRADAPVILSDRADGLVVRVGDAVLKAHPQEADAGALLARLRVAAALHEILLPPLGIPDAPGPGSEASQKALLVRLRGRLVTMWPFGEPLSPEHPEAAPWEEAAMLLARLHATPLHALPDPGALPAMGGPGRVARAMDRLRISDGTDAAEVVRRAFAGLPPWARGVWPPPVYPGPVAAGALVHGDWHFGQMVRRRAARAPAPGEASVSPGDAGDWRLIDIDDLGVGDPAWDLARPAAWYASGLLLPEDWMRFLSAYRAKGGCAVPREGEPWLTLDVPARALTVQSAALEVAAATREGRPLDETGEALVEACRRISLVDTLPQTP